jgi:hypothetical protein
MARGPDVQDDSTAALRMQHHVGLCMAHVGWGMLHVVGASIILDCFGGCCLLYISHTKCAVVTLGALLVLQCALLPGLQCTFVYYMYIQLRIVLLYYVNVQCKSSSAPNGNHCKDYNAHFDIICI